MLPRWLLPALLLLVQVGSVRAEDRLTFEQHVRPILKAHCFQCHGEEEKPKGKLDLRLEPTDEEKTSWSFQPIRRPDPPRLKDSHRAATPIDAFLLARLESKGLDFAPEADRTTLIRRVTFDLTGLPPTPGEVDRFLA